MRSQCKQSQFFFTFCLKSGDYFQVDQKAIMVFYFTSTGKYKKAQNILVLKLTRLHFAEFVEVYKKKNYYKYFYFSCGPTCHSVHGIGQVRKWVAFLIYFIISLQNWLNFCSVSHRNFLKFDIFGLKIRHFILKFKGFFLEILLFWREIWLFFGLKSDCFHGKFYNFH